MSRFDPQEVLDLWFPDSGHGASVESHTAFWTERMQGGMDAVICDRFADLTLAAARRELDHWAETPRGRIALILALDQFPRSLWRDMPGAYAQDVVAARLALEGLANGHFAALDAPWEKAFYVISITHCEGPEHMSRLLALDPVVQGIVDAMPPQLAPMGPMFISQHDRAKSVISRFGRHPHRNAILGRVSSRDEEEYIAEGDFPHLPRPAQADG